MGMRNALLHKHFKLSPADRNIISNQLEIRLFYRTTFLPCLPDLKHFYYSDKFNKLDGFDEFGKSIGWIS